MWSTWKFNKYLTFTPGLSQKNGRFQEETWWRELSSPNVSLPFKTGELEHMAIDTILGKSSAVPEESASKRFFLQNSQENISTRTSKVAVWKLQLHLRETPAQAFSCVYFKNSFFTEDVRVTASSLHRILLFRTLDYLTTSL